MKFDAVSDLHVDHWFSNTRLISTDGPKTFRPHPITGVDKFVHFDFQFFKNPDSDILIIAGDFCNGFEYGPDVLLDASQAYEHVIFVDGNHEHYRYVKLDPQNGKFSTVQYPVEANICRINSIASQYPNVHFLSGGKKTPCWVIIGNTMFVGGNGWYDFRAYTEFGISVEAARSANDGINDGTYIAWDTGEFKTFTEMSEEFAYRNAVNISQAIRDAQDNNAVENIVVVTHTIPDVRLNPPKFIDRNYDAISTSYINSKMFELCRNADYNNKIKAWVYGHTHNRTFKEIDGIQFVNNAYGRKYESSNWFMAQIEV